MIIDRVGKNSCKLLEPIAVIANLCCVQIFITSV